MTCMVDGRPSPARSRFLCVGPWCTAPIGTASQAPANGVWALVRTAIGQQAHFPDLLEGLHGGHMRFELPIVPRHQ